MPPVEHKPVDRRRFLRATGVAAISAGVGAGVAALPARSYAAVAGANARLRVGFLGCGARAQAHVHLVTKLANEGKPVAAVAVCDVWDGHDDEYDQPTPAGGTVRRRYTQGLFPAAAKCKLDPADRVHVTRDYRRILDAADVDAVCIGTPDHWHARMALDAMAAGKDVLCETPLARTAAEAVAVTDAATRHGRVLATGAQALADPVWAAAREAARAGKLGRVSHVSGGAFRSDPRGQWRFYRVTPTMTPATIDWDLFLGHGFAVNGEPIGPPAATLPFSPAAFAQWRCEGLLSGGPFTDLFIAPLTRLMLAGNLRWPNRVTAAGSLLIERDGRSVPDVATLAADFDGGHLTLTSTTTSSTPQDDLIRGTHGTLKFVKGGYQLLADGGATARETVAVASPRNETETLWLDFLDCVARRDAATLCPPDLAAAAATVAAMARQGFDEGRTLAWDGEARAVTGVERGWFKKHSS
jgi:predicted dehydrogenase